MTGKIENGLKILFDKIFNEFDDIKTDIKEMKIEIKGMREEMIEIKNKIVVLEKEKCQLENKVEEICEEAKPEKRLQKRYSYVIFILAVLNIIQISILLWKYLQDYLKE